MKALYISSLCCPQRAKEMELCFKKKLLTAQAQKFNLHMVNGLINNGYHLEHLTTCSHLSKFAHKRYLKKAKHNYSNTIYYSLPVLFVPILQFIFAVLSTFIFTLRWSIKNRKEEIVIICDIMEYFHSVGAWLASKIMKVNIIAIVTDLPEHTVGRGDNTNFIKKIMIKRYKNFTTKFINRFSAYVLLTKHMNEVVNKRHKPFVIIEGMVDKDMEYRGNSLENKYKKKVLLYAGFLEKRHGVNMLVDAFSKTSNPDYELHIYGTGGSVDYINRTAKADNRIKYFGLVCNDVVVSEEIKATLLINPRPSNQEFTKYSFPSKNMEYMVSGTPVLTTALPGMPKEYYNYVYIIETETVEGLIEAIDRNLSRPLEELNQFGCQAKQFVLNNKNYNIQAKKVVELIKNLEEC